MLEASCYYTSALKKHDPHKKSARPLVSHCWREPCCNDCASLWNFIGCHMIFVGLLLQPFTVSATLEKQNTRKPYFQTVLTTYDKHGYFILKLYPYINKHHNLIEPFGFYFQRLSFTSCWICELRVYNNVRRWQSSSWIRQVIVTQGNKKGRCRHLHVMTRT